ncbi:MAG: tetratricopeptide repeat protein [Cyanobacteriota bacterium]
MEKSKKQTLILASVLLLSLNFTQNTKAETIDGISNNISYSTTYSNEDYENQGLSDYLSNLKRYFKDIRKNPNSSKWKKVPENLLKAFFWIRENPSDKNFYEIADIWIELSNKVKNKELKPYSKMSYIFANLIKNDFKEAKNLSLSSNGDKNLDFLIKSAKAIAGESKKIKAFMDGHKYAINYEIQIISEIKALNLIKEYPNESIPYYMNFLVNYQKELELAGKEERELNINSYISFLNKALEIEPTNLFYNEKKLEITYDYKNQEKSDKYFEELLKSSKNDSYLAEQIATFYARNKLVDRSISYLKIALKSDTSRAGLYRKLNSLYTYSEKINEAIALYEDAIKKFPNNTEFYGELADMYIKNKESNKKVITLFSSGVNNNPFDTGLRVDLGDAFYYEKDTEKAIEQYKEAIKINRFNVEAYGKMITTYFEISDYDNVIKYAQESLKSNPDFYMANVWLGTCYTKLQKNTEAFEYFKKAVKQAPNNIITNNALGVAYKDDKKFDLALEYLNKALKLAPDNLQTILYIADVYYQNGDIKKAEETYEIAVKKDVYNEVLLLSAGNFYSDIKKYDKSKEYFEKAILINPNLFDARNNLGNLYIKTNKYDSAIDVFENIIKINDKYSTAYYNLACIYSLKKEPKLSIKYLEQSILLDKNMKDVARKDSDFDNLKDNKDFKKLVF